MTKRDAILELYRAGTPISKIIKQLELPKSTVYGGYRSKNGRFCSYCLKRTKIDSREKWIRILKGIDSKGGQLCN